jgi:hypothetical protein
MHRPVMSGVVLEGQLGVFDGLSCVKYYASVEAANIHRYRYFIPCKLNLVVSTTAKL